MNSGTKHCRDNCITIATINNEISDLLKRTDQSKKDVILQEFAIKIKTENYIRRLKQLFYAFLCLLVFACVLKLGCFDRFISWSFRRASVKVVSKLDWYRYINQKCYVPNPSKYVRHFQREDCEQCETINSVALINDTEKTNFKRLVKYDIPVAIKYSGPGEFKVFANVTDFVDLFLSIDALAEYEPCEFASNLKGKVDDHRQLLNLIDTDGVTSFYAHWENCADISFKAFRQFYERPKFLPPNIQLTDSNWAMLCVHYDGRTLKPVQVTSPLFIMMVMKGNVEITLSPRDICQGYCSEITETLYEGTVLLLTDTLWLLHYTPSCKNNETILFGINGYFD